MVGAGDADRGQRHPPTVRETAAPDLLDTPASQHVFQAVAACRKSRSGPRPGGCLRIVRFPTVWDLAVACQMIFTSGTLEA